MFFTKNPEIRQTAIFIFFGLKDWGARI